MTWTPLHYCPLVEEIYIWTIYEVLIRDLLSVVVFTEMRFLNVVESNLLYYKPHPLFDTGSWPAPSLSCVSRWTWPDSSWRMKSGIWTARSSSWTPCRVKLNCSGESLWDMFFNCNVHLMFSSSGLSLFVVLFRNGSYYTETTYSIHYSSNVWGR